MKKSIMYGMIVLFAAGLLLLAGCPQESSSSGAPSLLSAPNVKDAPAWESDVPFVKDRDEAYSLFRNFFYSLGTSYSTSAYSKLESILADADSTAFEKEFIKSNGSWLSFVLANLGKKSISFSQKIDDTTELAKAIDNNVTASIKGSSSVKFSANKPLFTASMTDTEDTPVKGDTVSFSTKTSRTFSITSGSAKVNGYTSSITYNVAGVIKTEYSGSGSSKVTEVIERKNGDDKVFYETIDSESSKNEYQTAAVLTLSDGKKAAKFRFSLSDGGEQKSRNTGKVSGNIKSDIEVYDGNNKLQYTIPSGWVDSITDYQSGIGHLGEKFVYTDFSGLDYDDE